MTASPPKKGWLSRLADGLSKSSSALGRSISAALGQKTFDADAWRRLEEELIEADLGPSLAASLVASLAQRKFSSEATERDVRKALADLIAQELKPRQGVFDPLSGPRPYVVLFVGVNGSGKTTTLGKIASDLTGKGAKVLIAAGDTFRAAAVEQLRIWADRAGAGFEARPTGSDAASLAFEAVSRAKLEGYDVVLIDTAGRLQNKTALMDELLKIIRVIKKLDPEAPHETLLVLDATVGRNALSQEQIFGRAALVSGLVMTKLDGTARGGVLAPIARASDAPIKLIGVGEGVEDLQPFDAAAFSRSLLGLEDLIP